MILTADDLYAELLGLQRAGSLSADGVTDTFARYRCLFPLDIGDRPAPSRATCTVLGYATLADRGEL
jgi:hypothetical protein